MFGNQMDQYHIERRVYFTSFWALYRRKQDLNKALCNTQNFTIMLQSLRHCYASHERRLKYLRVPNEFGKFVIIKLTGSTKSNIDRANLYLENPLID